MSRLPQAERRRQLVEAAITVMKRDGVGGATTRAIVAEAGTSLSVFHYCFASKQELLEAVIRQLVGTTVELAEASFPDDAAPAEMVRAGLAAYWDHVTSDPDHHLLTYELTQYCLRTPGLEEVARHQYEHYGHTFVVLLELLGLEPSIPLPDLGRYLAVMVDGLTLDWLARRDDASAARTIALIVDQVAAVL
ncbi:MAG TPA: TetR/AcrR family transcriptional regulator [Nocardioides sp.]|nr:TetR/AcrR family transcriptional regulator [Nocardioides sp.]